MRGPDQGRRNLLIGGGAGLVGVALGRRAHAAGAALEGWLGAGPATFTLSNGTLLLHTGERIPRAGIRVVDGRITALGTDVTGGEDLAGAWVVPGFTDAGCTVGLYEIGAEDGTRDDQETSDAVTPDARVVDAYNPLSEVVPVTRGGGFSHVLVHPTPAGLVSGQAALLRTVGRTVAESSVEAPLGLCIQLGNAGKGNGGPDSRMGVASRLRDLFEAAEPSEPAVTGGRKSRRPDAKPDDGSGRGRIEKLWQDTRSGVLPVLFHADRADDLLQAISLSQDYGLRGILVGAAEGWIVAREIAEAEMPVLLGPPMAQPDSFERPHARYDNAGLLDAAGVQLAFRSGANHFARGLRTDVGVLVAHGLPWERAIYGLTAAAGDIFGVEGHGHLAVGRTADFFLSAGDPLQPRYPVLRMWIDGREVGLTSRQTLLRDRFESLE